MPNVLVPDEKLREIAVRPRDVGNRRVLPEREPLVRFLLSTFEHFPEVPSWTSVERTVAAIKATGDVYQVLLNGKPTPVKEQDDPDKALFGTSLFPQG